MVLVGSTCPAIIALSQSPQRHRSIALAAILQIWAQACSWFNVVAYQADIGVAGFSHDGERLGLAHLLVVPAD